MSHLNVIRAWKDAEYRASLSAEQLAVLPAHPAGLIELSDAELDGVAGGKTGPTAPPKPKPSTPGSGTGCGTGTGTHTGTGTQTKKTKSLMY